MMPREVVAAVGALAQGAVARRMRAVFLVLAGVALVVAGWTAYARVVAAERRAERAEAALALAESVVATAQAERLQALDVAAAAERDRQAADAAVTRAGARLDAAMARWRERRGAGEGGEPVDPVAVAPVTATPSLVQACDEMASACQAFRDSAVVAQAASDSAVRALRAVVAGEDVRTRAVTLPLVQENARLRRRATMGRLTLVAVAAAGFWLGRR